MSDMNAWNGGNHADDPFAPEVVEGSIAGALRPEVPAAHTAVRVRSLAAAYALPPAADAALARSRATLARRAEALNTGGHQMNSSDTDTWPAPTRSTTRPPQPPRRRLSPFELFLRSAAAVLVVPLLAPAFYPLPQGIQTPATHPHPPPP